MGTVEIISGGLFLKGENKMQETALICFPYWEISQKVSETFFRVIFHNSIKTKKQLCFVQVSLYLEK